MTWFSTPTVTRLLLPATLLVASCAKPYSGDDADQRLQEVLEGAISRELAGNQEDSTLQVTPTLESQIEETLAPRRAELDQIGPVVARGGQPLDLGEDLLGQAQEEVFISLREAIESTIKNNLLGQNARLAQGISETRIVQAQAAFDAVFFSDFNFTRLQQPQVVPQIEVLSPTPPFRQTQDLSTSVRNVKQWNIETGLRNQLTSGGAIEVSTSVGYDDIADSDGISYNPDPAWSSAITLGITQPLLRGFGSEVALSELRLARNAARASTEDLREQLLNLIANVEAAYWQLVLARQKLAASEWLLEVGIEIRDVLAKRREIDATAANYADAVATVERRRGDLIVSQRDIRYSSDALKVIMNDPGLPVGQETLVAPADWMTDEPMRYNLGEAIAITIDRSPVVRRALLLIDDAAIGINVADNGRLPQLDLSGQVRWNGLEGGVSSSYENLVNGGLVDYLLGLQFSQAIGNQAAEAVYRRARLERSSAVVAYQRSIQQSVIRVKNALRDVRTSSLLIGQTRALRLAQAENLRALRVTQQTMGQLTPEFLSLKFQRQDGLASAQVREVQALVEYNTAIARLFESMGIGLQMNQIELQLEDRSTPLESAVSSSVGSESR